MSSTAISRLIHPFVKDRFLHALLLAGVAMFAFHPQPLSALGGFIDGRTLITLLGLMLLTKGVEVSGYFDFVGRKIINRLHSERRLALFLVFSAALLSSFLTNDVALFIVIPLTITLKKLSALPVGRLIIFQALAVNAGSLLTPIGNPQNILLWSRSGLSFLGFIGQMAPFGAAMMLSLLALTWFSFPARDIVKTPNTEGYPYQRLLLLSCVGLYAVFLLCLDFDLPLYGLLAVFAGFLLLARRVLLQIDWSLIFVFAAMFIDVGLFTRLPPLQPAFAAIAKAIRAMNVDVVALQEVDKLTARSGRVDQAAELAKLTGMQAVFGRAIDFDGGEYGLAFLSKYPLHDAVIYPLPSGQREQRIAFSAKVDVPEFPTPITLFNTHLDTKEDPTMRLDQVRELNDRTIEVRGIKLLFGDMNDVPGSVTWLELSRYWNDIMPNGQDGRSWPAENAEIKVDYIFSGNAQRWHLDSLTVPNASGDWNGVHWPAVSDHLPLVAEMRLTEQ